MGFLRLWLATMVLASHSDLGPFVGAGVLAVECFFVISGFYIQMIITEHYSHQPNWIRKFYKSRMLRIYTPYWVILAAILIAAQFLPADPNHVYVTSVPTDQFGIATNLFIIGSEHLKLLQLINDCKVLAADKMVISVAWSVGIELMFYAVAPWLLTRFALTVWITILSLGAKTYFLFATIPGITGLSCWSEFLNDIFPFELGVFTLGSLGYHFYKRFLKTTLMGRHGVYLSIISILICTMLIEHIFYLPMPYMVIGYYLFVLLVVIMAPLLFAATFWSSWDRAVGELSYPFYLLHWHVLYWCSLLGLNRNKTFLLAFAVTASISYLIVRVVDEPLTRLRHRWYRDHTSAMP